VGRTGYVIARRFLAATPTNTDPVSKATNAPMTRSVSSLPVLAIRLTSSTLSSRRSCSFNDPSTTTWLPGVMTIACTSTNSAPFGGTVRGGGTSDATAVVGGDVLGVSPGTVVAPATVVGMFSASGCVVAVVDETGSDVVVEVVDVVDVEVVDVVEVVVPTEVEDPLGTVVEVDVVDVVDVVEVVEVEVVEVDDVVVVSSGGRISCTAQPASITACPSGQFNPG